jgi:PAS domain S-box-containing protein
VPPLKGAGPRPGPGTRGALSAAPPPAALVALLDEIGDALAWFDPARVLRWCNRAAAETAGLRVGQSAAVAAAPLGDAAVQWLHTALAAPERREATLRAADGRRWRCTVFPQAGGHVWQLRERHEPSDPGRAAGFAAGPPSAEAAGSAGSAAPAAAAAPVALATPGGLAASRPPPAQPAGSPWIEALHTLVREAPFAAYLQGPDWRLLEASEAFAALCGRPRAALIGLDPIELQPPLARGLTLSARELTRTARAEAGQRDGHDATPPAAEPEPPEAQARELLLTADGRECWFAASRAEWALPEGGRLRLSLLLDSSAEQSAREHARRVEDELAQWFELAESGMLVYDQTGLIVRNNAAFEALADGVPEVMDLADPALQDLLGWHDGRAMPAVQALQAGGRPLQRQTLLPLAVGGTRRLQARLSRLALGPDEWRVMAVVVDRSTEDARDLAELQRGMLMNTASVGVATYDPERGWLAPGLGPYATPTTHGSAAPVVSTDTPAHPSVSEPAGEPAHESLSALQAGAAGVSQAMLPAARAEGGNAGVDAPVTLLGIGRDLVEPDSLPEFERLQRALRAGERAELRYAVRHPQLGPRWLLTRVEPVPLPGGRPTTSVLTLDVTEQEQALRRNEQLLRELTTILDGSTAGIAYLRGPVLVRCNRRFERMLGFAPGAAAGATLAEVFARQPEAGPLAEAAAAALQQGLAYETEIAMPAGASAAGGAAPATASASPSAPGAGGAALADGGPAQWYSLSVRRAEAGPGPLEAVAVLTDITRLKAQQGELERLLRDRELMFSLSDVGIAYLRGARIERANQALATLTGYATPELTTLDTAELYADARECVEFEARIAQALRSHGRFAGERRLRRRDGLLIWVQVTVRPVDAGDEGAGMIGSFVDIDERQRARSSLAQQAERTRAILNSVLVGIVNVSARGIEWMNQSARRMFGGELADFVGEPISTVATSEPDHPLRRSDWTERLAGGRSESFECRLVGRDGRTFWVVGNAFLTGGDGAQAGSSRKAGAGDGSGGAPELTFALLDIERRRQAEVAIAQAQASLQRVIETAPLAIALFDARDLRIVQANQTASAFFGREAALLTGAAPEDCWPAPRARLVRQWLQAAAAQAEPVRHELREDASALASPASAVPSESAASSPSAAGSGAAGAGPAAAPAIASSPPPAAAAATPSAPTPAPASEAAPEPAPAPAPAVAQASADQAPLAAAFASAPAAEPTASGRVWDCRIVALPPVAGGEASAQLLLVASDITEQRVAEQARLSAAIEQRERLVREVHHRIKNNLQGVAGLLQHSAARRPEVAAALTEAVGQVQAIAQVYGLQVGSQGRLKMASVMSAIAQSVQRSLNRPVVLHGADLAGPEHELGEPEAIPVALTLNELLGNAVKHGQGEVRCELLAVDDNGQPDTAGAGVAIRIASKARLPAGFDLARIRGGVSGLGLVRALLPRRTGGLSLTQRGDRVVAEVTLRPPSVLRPDPGG